VNHEELAKRVDKRLDKIEDKLDKHLELVSKHEADIGWMRGYVRTSLMFITSLTIGLITTFIRTMKGE